MTYRDYLTPEQLRDERVENIAIAVVALVWLGRFLLLQAGVLS